MATTPRSLWPMPFHHPRGDAHQSDDDHELTSLGEEIMTLAERLHAETHRWLMLIAEFDRLEGWKLYGFASCAEWLAYSTRLDKVTAREKVRVARALVGLPETSAAMSRGELSFSQVRAHHAGSGRRERDGAAGARALDQRVGAGAAGPVMAAAGPRGRSRARGAASRDALPVGVSGRSGDVPGAGEARPGGRRAADARDRGGERRALPRQRAGDDARAAAGGRARADRGAGAGGGVRGRRVRWRRLGAVEAGRFRGRGRLRADADVSAETSESCDGCHGQ